MQHIRQLLFFSAVFIAAQFGAGFCNDQRRHDEQTPGLTLGLSSATAPASAGLPSASGDRALSRGSAATEGSLEAAEGLPGPDKSADTGLPYGKFFTDGPSDKRKFALTFDDGPGAITKKLLKLLHKNNARASFFMTGAAVRRRPEIAAEVAESGNMVCNHTDSHVNFYRKSIDASRRGKLLEREIRLAEKSIEKAAGIRTRFLRMPNGYVRDWVKEVAGKTEYVLVNWTYGSDWRDISRKEMLKGYLKNLRPGVIFLFHDGGNKKRKTTFWLVEKILAEAKKKKLEPVRLDELLGLE